MSRPDTLAYVTHRLAVAGTSRELFSEAALDKLHRLSGGIPRRISALADRALLGTYARWQEQVGPEAVVQAAREVMGPAVATAASRKGLPRAAVAGLGAACGAAALSAVYHYPDAAALARSAGFFVK